MRDRSAFRYTVGLMVVIGGLCGLGALYALHVPDGNREPLLLALGIVLGWGSAVVNHEFGSSSAGRHAAMAGIKQDGGEA